MLDTQSQLEWIKTIDISNKQALGYRIATTSEVMQLALDSGMTELASSSATSFQAGQTVPNVGAPDTLARFGYDRTGVPENSGYANVTYSVALVASDTGLPQADKMVVIRESYPNAPSEHYVSLDIGAPGGYSPSSSGFYGLARNSDGLWHINPAGPVAAHLMVRAVPEAGTWAMMALGLLGLWGVKRSSQRR